MSSCPLGTHSVEGETGRRETACLTTEVLLQEARLRSSTIDTQGREAKSTEVPGAQAWGFELRDWAGIMGGFVEVSLVSKHKKGLAPKGGGRTRRGARAPSWPLGNAGLLAGLESAGLKCCWCGPEGEDDAPKGFELYFLLQRRAGLREASGRTSGEGGLGWVGEAGPWGEHGGEK